MPRKENERTMGRRAFLFGGAATLIGAGIALDRFVSPNLVTSAKAATGGPGPSESPSALPSASPSAGARALETPQPGLCPTVTELVTQPDFSLSNVAFKGAPINVDSKNIDLPRGQFGSKATINGLELLFAEPGGLLVGPDFVSKDTGNPNGPDNLLGAVKVWTSDGHIQFFDAETHAILRGCPPEHQLLPTNGLAMVIGNKFNVEVMKSDEKGNLVPDDGKVFVFKQLDQKNGGINFFAIKGLFADSSTQGQDRNRILRITGYVPGTVEVKMYKAGKNNTPWISERSLFQMARDAHSGQENCGTGCGDLFVTQFEMNSKAFSVVKQTADKGADFSQGWNLVYRNYNP